MIPIYVYCDNHTLIHSLASNRFCLAVDRSRPRSLERSWSVKMAASGFLKAAVIFALAIGAAAQFPCGAVPACENDPTFALFGIFPCSAGFGPDPCTFPEGSEACALQCFTCIICEDPEPIPGVVAIFQYELFGDSLIIYLDSTETVAGFQAQVGCTVGGKWESVGSLDFSELVLNTSLHIYAGNCGLDRSHYHPRYSWRNTWRYLHWQRLFTVHWYRRKVPDGLPLRYVWRSLRIVLVVL